MQGVLFRSGSILSGLSQVLCEAVAFVEDGTSLSAYLWSPGCSIWDPFDGPF
jgi:hypothetical protein